MHLTTMPLHLRRLLLGSSALTGIALASGAQAGQALPTGGVVTAGKATIAQPNANQLNVTTGTQNTVIDWTSFSIASGNKVTIQQPGKSAITVNEVTGQDPSQIFGELSSNGRVVLANPNGIWFGPESHVDVAGLVASTATLSDASKKAFAAGGRLSLDQAGKANASIQNDGKITIAGTGLAALVAPGVRNNGVIQATLGSVELASGTTSTLDFYGDGLVSLAVTNPVSAVAIGPDGKAFNATIENDGKIKSAQVLVTASVVKGVVDNVINMGGVTEAKGVTVSGGDIILDGGDGNVAVTGSLDATSQRAKGGNIAVTGGAVTLASTSSIDVSGATGGGTVQVGGGPHGGGTLKHATTTTVQAGASIKANATKQGDGGNVAVWSDGLTTFNGSIEAKGAGTGNGGWVETSGHYLSIATGMVDTSAPGGTDGTWLLDPFTVEIAHTNTSDSDQSTTSYPETGNATLNDFDITLALGNNDVSITTSGVGGNITLDTGATISWSSGHKLSLATSTGDTTGTINLLGTISGATNGGTLLLSTSGSATQGTNPITVSVLALTGTGGTYDFSTVANAVNVLAFNTGSVNLNDNGLMSAGLTLASNGNVASLHTDGALTATATLAGGLSINQAVSAGSLSLSVGAGDLSILGPLTTTTGGVTLSASGTISSSGGSISSFASIAETSTTGGITINDPITSTTGAIALTAVTTIQVSANATSAGAFTVTANPTVIYGGGFTETAGVTISATGPFEVLSGGAGTATHTITGTITAAGIDIEAAPKTTTQGGEVDITSTARITNTATGVSNNASSANTVFYTGAGSSGSISFTQGAQVVANSGNIAFITDKLTLAGSAVSEVSAPGTIIYSPASTNASFTGPSLSLNGSANTLQLTVGGTGSVLLPQSLITFLAGSGASATAGQNSATNTALQIGLPGTSNTTSISNGTTTLPIQTTIYGGNSQGGITISSTVTANAGLTLISSTGISIYSANSLTVSNGNFLAEFGNFPGFTEEFFSTIVANNGSVVIEPSTPTGSAPVTINGAISGKGVTIASAGPQATFGAAINIGSSGSITNTESTAANTSNSADLVLYTGPGSGGAIQFQEGASIVANSGNIALVTDHLNINTPSVTSTISAASGTIIYSPASTLAGFAGPGLVLNGAQGGGFSPTFGGTGTTLSQSNIVFLSGSGPTALPGQNSASNSALQIGLPGTDDTATFTGATSFPISTTVYGSSIAINSGAPVTFASGTTLRLNTTTSTGTGNIGINDAINGTGGTLSLASLGSVTQTAGITATNLELIGVSGAYDLSTAGNNVGTLAANAGSLNFVNGGSAPGLTVGTAGSTTGITLTGFLDLVTQSTNTDITISAPISAGAVTLSATHGITDNANITAAGAFEASTSNSGFFQAASSVISTTNGAATVEITTAGGGNINLNGTIQANGAVTLSTTIGSTSVNVGSGASITTPTFDVTIPSGGAFTQSAGSSISTGASGMVNITNSSGASNIAVGGTITGGTIDLGVASLSQASSIITLMSSGTLTAPSVTLQSGLGGSLTIGTGAGINAGTGTVGLYTDSLTLGSSLVLTAANVKIDTGSHNTQVFAAPDSNGNSFQLEPVLALGATSAGGPGLALPAATLAVLDAAVGTDAVTLGFSSVPVLVTVTGNITLPTNTTIVTDAFSIPSGATLTAGMLSISTRTPNTAAPYITGETNAQVGPMSLPVPTITIAGTLLASGTVDLFSAANLTVSAGASVSGANVFAEVGPSAVFSEASGATIAATGAGGSFELSDGFNGGSPIANVGGAITGSVINFDLLNLVSTGSGSTARFGAINQAAGINILGTANLTATSITLQSGPGGSLTIANGARLSAGTSGSVDLYTDHLTITGTPVITTSFLGVDTGAHNQESFTDASEQTQLEPTLALGATTAPASGLALSAATLSTLTSAIGTSGFATFGDGSLNASGNSFTTPVAVTATGSLTLPASTTIVGDSFTQISGTLTSAGMINIGVHTPTQLTSSLTPTAPVIALNGGITASNSIALEAPQISGTGTLTSGLVTLQGAPGLTVSGNLTATGEIQAQVAGGFSFTETSGASLTSNVGVIVYDSSTSSGSTISINGTITAPDIYLLASDHKFANAGQITLGSTGKLVNNSTATDFFTLSVADTILFAGVGGGITLNSGSSITANKTNIALLADNLTFGTGAAPMLSSQARVTVSPASTNGFLRGMLSIPDPLTSGSTVLIGLATPGGVTPLNIGVGTTGTDPYTVSQPWLNVLSGTGGTGTSPVERLQIGLAGGTDTMTLRGTINFPADTSFDAQNITIAANASVSTTGTSTFNFGATSPEPSSLIFVPTQTSASTASALTFAAGSKINTAGALQVSDLCLNTCTITPTTTFAGSITARNILAVSTDSEDDGSKGMAVTVAGTAVMTATGVPNTTSSLSFSDIVFQTGRGGSLTIAGGANLNAGQGMLGFYADQLSFGGTPTLAGASINVDTGTAGDTAFPGTPNSGNNYVQEEPTIAIGAVVVAGTTAPAGTLALSAATLATLATAAGTTPVTIGDITRTDFSTGSAVTYSTPVLVTDTGSVTLPTNTTITGDAFSQTSGATLTGGTLTINTRTPNNIADATQVSITNDLPPTLPTPTIKLNGTITTTGSETYNGSVVVNGVETMTSTGNPITFNGTLDDQTSRNGSLTIAAGSTGDVTFNGVVGGNGVLGAVTIASARNVTGPSDPTLLATALSTGTPEFQAASFGAGTANAPIAGSFTMVGGLSTNAATNAFSSASSTASRSSGALTINAAGAVTIGTINTTNSGNDLVVSARGADFSSSMSNSSSVAGNGAAISITGSSLTLSGVSARGGQSKTGSVLVGAGGNAGTIFLDATNGNVTILGGLFDTGVVAAGGQSMLTTGGAGGNGGTVTIDATGSVVVPGGVRVNGGNTLSGAGGNAGSITIDASTIALGRAQAQGGDTQASGTLGLGGIGGSITLIATGVAGTDIILAGNNSDFSGATGAVIYGTLLSRGGETGVTDVFNTDQGGTVANAGGSIVLEGSASGGALGGVVELVNSGTNGVTAPSTSFGGGPNVLISASGITGKGGSVQILGSVVAADDSVEGLRLGAGNGSVTITGGVGIEGGNRLNTLLLTGNNSAITIGGTLATDTITELRTSGSFTIDGDISTSTYTTPLGNKVLLSFANANGGNGNGGNGGGKGSTGTSGVGSSGSTSSSDGPSPLAISGTFLFTTPISIAQNTTTLLGTTVIDTSTNNSALTLGTVDGAFGLTVNAGTGTVISGTIGGTTPLSSLSIKAGTIGFGGSVTTTGAQTYTGPAIIGATSTLNGSSVQFTSTVDGLTSGTQSLTVTVTGSAEFDGTIGGTTPLQNFTLNAASVVNALPSIFVTGAQTINLPGSTFSGTYSFNTFTDNGAMILSGDTVITATGGAITIGGTIDGAHALTLNDSVGLISLTGLVGSGTALTSLTLTGSQGIVLGGTINTTGAQAYNGAVTLASATTLTGGGILFSSTIDGAQSLTLNAGSSAVALQGAAGAKAALASLTATAGTLSLGNVTTTGAQTYNGTTTVSGTFGANGFTAGGPLVLIGNTSINGGTGNITFGSTVQGTFNLALASTNANVFFDGTVGLATARLPLLSITGANNATVLNNSSLFVHDFTATNIGGALSFGNHSLESDDVVTIQATSVDGRVISTSSATIMATSLSGIIQGSTVNVTATGAVSEQITADNASVSGGSFSGSVAATRSANIATTGDISANVSVSGGSATVSGANVSGSVTSSGLAQISATQNVSADVTGGSVAIVAGATVSGAVTSTAGGVNIQATDVSSAITAPSNSTVQVAATNSITGSVSGGNVSLTAPTVSEAVNANTATITATNTNVTGTIGGIDASAVQATASNVTQSVLGATQQVASNTVTDNNAGSVSGGDDQAAGGTGDDDDDKKKKKKEGGPVYDFANQYIDNLIAGKKGN